MVLRSTKLLRPDVLDLKEDYPDLFELWCECVNLDDTVCMLLEEDEAGNEKEIKKLKEKYDAIWKELQLARKLIRNYDDDRLQSNI